MRIVVANTQVPFATGGAELHGRNLVAELQRAGHDAELVTIPFVANSSDSIIEQALAASNFDLSESFGNRIDLMIGLRFPAYFMTHPNKVVWLIHQHREFYELWEKSGNRNFLEGDRARRAVTTMDSLVLSKAKAIHANSHNVAERLKRYNQISAATLYHPPPLHNDLHPGPDGAYLLFPSRISKLKRQDLCLDALAMCKEDVRLVIVGSADNAEAEKSFLERARSLKLGDRLDWRGFVPDDELVELYANARAVVFTPYDEDLGYVTLQAMLAAKPVITSTDAGGPLEFVQHGKTGLIGPPEPKGLSALFDNLWADPDHAARLGEAGRARYDELAISWDNVVRTLTGE